MLPFVCIADVGFKITETNQPSAYSEMIGEVKFVEGVWKFVICLDKTFFENEFDYINTLRNNFDILCKESAGETSEFCIRINNEILPIVEHIKYNKNIIDHYYKIRDRRGLFNGFGRAANTLFGVMDDKDSENINTQIEELNTHQITQKQLFDEQTVILKTEINIIEDISKNTATQLHKIKYNFKLLNATIHTVELVKVRSLLNSIVGEFLLITNTITQNQERIIQIFIFAKTNKIHPTLFSDDDFIKAKSNITLKPGLYFNNNLNTISSVQIKHINSQKIIFEISMPIFNSMENFRMIRLVPLPFKIQNTTYKTINLSYNYIIINNINEKFMLMTSDQKSRFCSISNKKHICNHGLKMMYSNHFKPCEFEVALKYANNTCSESTLEIPDNMFSILENGHTLHYLLITVEKLNIICYNKNNMVNLINTGIIEFTTDCEIRTDGFTQQILHKTEGISEAKIHFFENHIHNNTSNTYARHLPTLQELPDISHKETIDRLKTEIGILGENNKLNSQQYLKKHLSIHDIIIYIVLSLLSTFVILYTIYKYIKKLYYSFTLKENTTQKTNTDLHNSTC